MRGRRVFLLVAAFAVQLWPGQEILKDSLQRTIRLPAKADRILSVQPEITRIVIALGEGEKLVGVDYFISRNDHFIPAAFPCILRLPPVSVTPEDLNFETVMRLNPDIIFASPTEARMVDNLEKKLNKPVAALASMGSLARLQEQILIVGSLLGAEARAGEVVSYIQKKLQAVAVSVSAASAEKKPRVYLAFWGLLSRTPVLYEPVNAAGGINCAENLLPPSLGTIGTSINVEQILEWDPDFILVHGNYPPRERSVSVDGILRDSRFASLKAVRQKNVRYTFGYWYWWDPAQVLIETLYLARIFFPNSASSFDLEKEGNDVYQKIYGVKNGFTSVSRILHCHEWIKK
jgi:iron complex transport system substrate-binding protein